MSRRLVTRTFRHTITRTGNDNWSVHSPRTDADRQRSHGRLIPMDRPDGEPSALAGIALLVGLFLAGAGLIVAFNIGG